MMNRRNFVAGIGMGAVSAAIPSTKAISPAQEKRYQKGRSPWPICLDTATIRPASLEEKIEIAAKAGFDAIEPWDMELAEYEASGGNLKELGQRIRDLGLFAPSMIGLWGCIPDSEEKFQASLAATRNRMRMASEIGCEFVQAIPNEVGLNYDQAFVTSCYRRILEIGLGDYNINPALVFVKMFPLKTLGQATAVAIDADHPKAKIIPDVYHMYISKGGFENMRQLNGDLFAIFQYNDAPSGMNINDMTDADRVYPGDGILPLSKILQDLKATGFNRCVSLELYNPNYHKQDLLTVAKTGLEKTLVSIEKAGV
ncbi:sugar phosphate isomerase/epimerase family protein [Fulvivirga sedimenti]|uniref:Sugar phosphate isomerase/epimerase n=1 Tax=Fulvivirga sedimenti TaxID=2879465 RepID=A0A9X1HY23_9BACT|nr:sugar phosphate isomerase/epimerase family protein [Fulvivirga sedimenti]MCA6078837.1 sugar phosphate isomerase/epimerase [Fulvivirga sedimenti]